jgi:hypothetical protein
MLQLSKKLKFNTHKRKHKHTHSPAYTHPLSPSVYASMSSHQRAVFNEQSSMNKLGGETGFDALHIVFIFCLRGIKRILSNAKQCTSTRWSVGVVVFQFCFSLNLQTADRSISKITHSQPHITLS